MAGFRKDAYRRFVIKVGSSLLIDSNGELDRGWLAALASDVAEYHSDARDVIVVSSGAIAIGSGVLGINKRRARLEDLQAAAAAGQVQLAHAWSEALAEHGIKSAQILLTPGDTENRRRFLNARGTLGKLLERRVVPIVNENDTVATEEIRYGDNDRLAARVAQLVMADALILLSDVDGLYSSDPGKSDNAEHIAVVSSVDDSILAMAGETRSDIGSGGMATKVRAAAIATHAGCSTIVASGARMRPLAALAAGARCTIFTADGTPAAARKPWLGSVKVDAGAARALRDGGSLLPVGVTGVTGDFKRGDVVRLKDSDGIELGRGLAEYAAVDASRIAGRKSEEIEQILGYRGRAVMIHRDELVLFENDR